MLKKTAVATIVLSTLAGCKLLGPSQVCTPDTRVDIPAAEVTAKSSGDLKIIVLPIDMDFSDSAKKKLTSVYRNDLEAQISDSGAKLVDRKLANKLKNEIKLAEQSGRYNTKGVPIADMAVLTEITASDFSKSYSDAYSYTNKKGETVRVAAKCNYRVDIKAVSKVVSLPSMELVKRIDLKGSSSISTETRNSSCNFSQSQYSGLASKAATKSVNYNHDFSKLLAPTASVIELRQCEAGSMVKINMGKDKNITPGADIQFSKIMKVDNETETHGYGEGYVVNVEPGGIGKKFSWVSIDEKTALKVQKGDEVKVMPKGCDWNIGCRLSNL